MNMEKAFNNQENMKAGEQSIEQQKKREGLRQEMSVVLKKLAEFEQQQREIAAAVRKFKREWGEADSQERESIKNELGELANKLSILKKERSETEEAYAELEQAYNAESDTSE
jgi:chromosome segregation ATPase